MESQLKRKRIPVNKPLNCRDEENRLILLMRNSCHEICASFPYVGVRLAYRSRP